MRPAPQQAHCLLQEKGNELQTLMHTVCVALLL